MGHILISASVCAACLMIAVLSQLMPMPAWSASSPSPATASVLPGGQQAAATVRREGWELDPDDPNPALFAMAPEDGASGSTAEPDTGEETVENVRITASGLKIIDTAVGTGAEAVAGATVQVHYDGRLENGKEFDSSRKRGQPFQFRLGAGMVIKGWDEGIAGMKEGGKRQLVIPPELGYGKRGAGGVIPPNATLVFDVELLRVAR